MVQGVNVDETEMDYQKKLEMAYEVIRTSGVLKKKEIELQIGVGDVVEGYEKLDESYLESKKAIRYMELMQLSEDASDKPIMFYSKLGFFRIFGDIEDKAELEKYVPETLKRLYRYDKERNGELVLTLQTFLNHNQSLKKTAQEMHVHYRTVCNRIERIKEISGIDFHNPNEVLTVSNGLVIYRMIHR